MSEAIEYKDPGVDENPAVAAVVVEAALPASDSIAAEDEAKAKVDSEADVGVQEVDLSAETPAPTAPELEDIKTNEGKARIEDPWADRDSFFMCIDSLKNGIVRKGHHVANVTVRDPQTTKTLTSSYTTYAVRIEPKIEEVKFVRRRYSDFVWLRTWLSKAFPGIFIPPLPPKSVFGKMKRRFIEERRLKLQGFMLRLIARHPFIMHSLPFQLFISKHSNTFEKQKRDVHKLVNSQTASDLTKMYQSVFQNLSDVEFPKDPTDRVLRLKDYLTTSGKQVGVLLESSGTIADRWADIVNNSSKVTEAFKSLSKVEKGYAQRPDPPRMDVVGKFEKWTGVVNHKPRQWSSLVVEIFKSEKLDIEAMMEVVKFWEGLKKKLTRDEERVTKYAKIEGGLNDKQKTSMKKDEATLSNTKELFSTVTKILFESELLHYWKKKMGKFNTQVQSFFKSQLETSNQLATVWQEMKADNNS